MTGLLLRLLKTGLAAGFLAALVYTAVQAVTVTPLIQEAETYEHAAGAHGHATTSADRANNARLVLVHEHEDAATAAWAPADGIERLGFTFLANLVSGIGFALVLAAAMALRGRPVDWRSGVAWGIAGFAVFTVAPSLGLPPEVPGSAAADLAARQLWWAATAAATAGGLALIAFAPRRLLQGLGVALLLAPHVVGAPQPATGEHGVVPPELAAHFVVRTLAAAALFWAVIGGACGAFYRRFA